MPFKTDTKAIKDPFLDRRAKLLPCQKEMIVFWHRYKNKSVKELAIMFKVNRRTVDFLVNPEKLAENIRRRKERGGSKQYYNKEYATKKMREHRQRKHKELKPFLIPKKP